MEQKLFNTISELEMQDEKERLQGLPATERIRALHPDSAKLLMILVTSNKAQHIVEVGSGAGYSTLWLAYAASLTGGRVVTCDSNPAKVALAQANLKKAGMADYVEILTGDAREILRERQEPVDFLFIDANKGQYETYFDVVYKNMGVGAMIVADNVVSHEDELADYITYMQNHPSLESVTTAIGRGLEVSVKITE